jgi:hypothetical protein
MDRYWKVMPGASQSDGWKRLCRLGEATVSRERHGLGHDDADDVTGTAATDDAIGFNPLPLLRTLHEHGAVVAVMGPGCWHHARIS